MPHFGVSVGDDDDPDLQVMMEISYGAHSDLDAVRRLLADVHSKVAREISSPSVTIEPPDEAGRTGLTLVPPTKEY